ncbi:MAG: hypothetical protein ABI675_24315 [Chitinophagaceae bacterium]
MKIKRSIEEVLPIADSFVEKFKPFCEKIEICGSIRRKKSMVGDIEILCIPKKIRVPVSKQYSLFGDEEYTEITDPGLMEIIRGYKILRGDLDGGKIVSFETPEDIQVDGFTATSMNYGYIKVLRTGSAEYNQYFVLPRLKARGYRMNGFIFKNEIMVPTPDEQDIYELIDSEFHLPEDRGQMSYYY